MLEVRQSRERTATDGTCFLHEVSGVIRAYDSKGQLRWETPGTIVGHGISRRLVAIQTPENQISVCMLGSLQSVQWSVYYPRPYPVLFHPRIGIDVKGAFSVMAWFPTQHTFRYFYLSNDWRNQLGISDSFAVCSTDPHLLTFCNDFGEMTIRVPDRVVAITEQGQAILLPKQDKRPCHLKVWKVGRDGIQIHQYKIEIEDVFLPEEPILHTAVFGETVSVLLGRDRHLLIFDASRNLFSTLRVPDFSENTRWIISGEQVVRFVPDRKRIIPYKIAYYPAVPTVSVTMDWEQVTDGVKQITFPWPFGPPGSSRREQ